MKKLFLLFFILCSLFGILTVSALSPGLDNYRDSLSFVEKDLGGITFNMSEVLGRHFSFNNPNFTATLLYIYSKKISSLPSDYICPGETMKLSPQFFENQAYVCKYVQPLLDNNILNAEDMKMNPKDTVPKRKLILFLLRILGEKNTSVDNDTLVKKCLFDNSNIDEADLGSFYGDIFFYYQKIKENSTCNSDSIKETKEPAKDNNTPKSLSNEAKGFDFSTGLGSANYLASYGIIVPQKTTSGYRLDDTITRAELVGIALKIKGIPNLENYQCKKYFSDVVNNDWICSAVELAADNNMISKTNKKYRPQDKISRAEAFSILFKTVSLPSPSWASENLIFGDRDIVDWQRNIFNSISHVGVLPIPGYVVKVDSVNSAGTFVYPNRSATRSEVFTFAARLLLEKNKIMSGEVTVK